MRTGSRTKLTNYHNRDGFKYGDVCEHDIMALAYWNLRVIEIAISSSRVDYSVMTAKENNKAKVTINNVKMIRIFRIYGAALTF